MPTNHEHHRRQGHLNHSPTSKASCYHLTPCLFFHIPSFLCSLLQTQTRIGCSWIQISAAVVAFWGTLLPIHRFMQKALQSRSPAFSVWAFAVEIFIFSSVKTKLFSWLRFHAVLTAFAGVLPNNEGQCFLKKAESILKVSRLCLWRSQSCLIRSLKLVRLLSASPVHPPFCMMLQLFWWKTVI